MGPFEPQKHISEARSVGRSSALLLLLLLLLVMESLLIITIRLT